MTAIPATALNARTPPPADPPEAIEVVLNRLESPVRRRGASPLFSSLAAICTFGLLPLWIWPQRWQAAVEQDRRDFFGLAAWWARQSPARAEPLTTAARGIGRGAGLISLLLTAVAGATSLLLAWSLMHGVSLKHLAEAVYARPRRIELGPTQLWMAVLIVAYSLHFLSVQAHIASVKRYLSAVDASVHAVGLPAIAQRYSFSGLGVMWVLCGLALCGSGIWWGAPLVLAGARQRQYLRRIRPQMRRELAQQVRAAIGQRPIRLATCSTIGCRAPLPPMAGFCPRCGATA